MATLGIDFGTSYCAAASVRDGRVEHIDFDGRLEFRTAVFCPEVVPTFADFVLTPALEAEVDAIVASITRDYRAAMARYTADRERILRERDATRREAMLSRL